MAAFDELTERGLIRHWGVSNFGMSDMEELLAVPGGGAVQTNQVLYNLARRGIEWDVLPWSLDHRHPVMAYSPVAQGQLPQHSTLQAVADGHEATAAQVALAWVLRLDGVSAIPKASKPGHVLANYAALDLRLSPAELAALDSAFPPPSRPERLAVI